MNVEAGGLLDWVKATFFEFSWQDMEERFGAFHDVVISQSGFVARVAHGADHQTRARRERSTLQIVPAADLPVAVPQVLTEVETKSGRSGYIVTRVPGNHESASGWEDLRSSYQQLLLAFAGASTDIDLRPARTWCGGGDLVRIVSDELSPLLGGHRDAAVKAIEDMLALPQPRSSVFVHGDFGHHNVLWNDTTAVSLIDFDHACVDDQAIDVAPLVGRYGADSVREIVSDDLVTRAMVHRATLSLQVAAAAHLARSQNLRDHAISNFARRHDAGTLHDPGGKSP